MKTSLFKTLVALGLALAASAHILRAQSYSIDWLTIDGGGGTSTGGVYTVSGTIGQPDAGQMTGGSYAFKGGFWSILGTVQTPGAPLLRIVRSANNTVVVAWPTPSAGFSLQQNSILGTTNWVSVTNVPVAAAGENQVIVSPPTGNRFYRLSSP